MTSTAEKVVVAKKEEKVEKRRALGRGLDSLLPGPRAVAPPSTEYRVPGTERAGRGSEDGAAGDRDAASGQQIPHRLAPVRNDKTTGGEGVGRPDVPIGGGGAGGEQQVPHFVRNDKTTRDDKTIGGAAAAATGTGRADGPVGGAGAGGEQQVPHFVRNDNTTRNDKTTRDDKTSGVREDNSVEREELSGQAEGITIQAMAAAPTRAIVVKQIALDSIDENPYQTRYFFDEDALKELADSIQEIGVLQPVVVRPGEEEGRYILVLGERRLQASKLAKTETIPAIVRRVSEQQAAEMTLIENLQREDLNCMEQAEAFRVLSKEFNMTQEEIGKRVGMSRESVSNYMRLLRLPEAVARYLLEDRLSFSEARELLGLHDEKKMQEAADVVVGKHMTLEEIETLVAKYNGWPDAQDPQKKPRVGGGARWQDPNVRAAQTELEHLLRVRVRIKDRKGKGKIVIEYATVDDYERVLGMLKGKK